MSLLIKMIVSFDGCQPIAHFMLFDAPVCNIVNVLKSLLYSVK
jgi:hypothetical protein